VPGGRSPAGSTSQSLKRDGPRSFVSLIGFYQLIELLGDQAAERHSAVSSNDLRAPDGRVVKLDGQVPFRHYHRI
jgi:hypothetical protein